MLLALFSFLSNFTYHTVYPRLKPVENYGMLNGMIGKGVLYVNLQESGEMYLETIYILSQKSSFVRAIDVGEYMGYSKPSVSRAMGLLKQAGYVTADTDGFLTLTETGREIASKIYERHTVLQDLLMRLGVDEKNAATDACRMEHVISDQTFQAIRRHVEK